ncbi:uncharacterized protein LOC8271237 [Ricinus communis]|uniref:Polyamine-modulated factor 1-binding protein n=1 Tax=Ricinus communis TaxID=3988 RepID=B9RS78_RICCO|nr:uncharacterized protein LOC8271237 [Ricinus communis]XP_048228224.1 uncharacterized protein LOC8271237 [Ricinus communis]EEF45938.1 conserved hypothetical protein [Ricinus communis]|eukprot:XP_002516597.1 uncharacterized protein LOC8271237 [Ricinus communis]
MATPQGDSGPQPHGSPAETESQLSSLLYDLSQQVQMSMGNMLKMIAEIDQNSAGIMEEIAKCKDSAVEKKKALEEEKEKFQKSAYAVLDMLNNTC